MKKSIYGLALIAFPVMAMAQGIPVFGGDPITTPAQVEQLKAQFEQLKSAQKPSGAALPVIDANQLTQLVQINYNLEQIKQKIDGHQAKDTNKFCYADDKAFSEGAAHAGSTCTRSSDDRDMVVFQENDSKMKTRALIWK